MGVFMAFPVLGVAIMLQTAIFSRLPLLSGTTDIILLMLIAWALQKNVKNWVIVVWTLVGAGFISFISAVPAAATIFGYTAIVMVTRWLRTRIWQASLLALFFMVVAGTFFHFTVVFSTLRFFENTPLVISESFVQVVLPSLVLNLLFAFPIYLLMKDLADWLYPSEVEFNA